MRWLRSLGLMGFFRLTDGFTSRIWVFWDISIWRVNVLLVEKQFVHMVIFGYDGLS